MILINLFLTVAIGFWLVWVLIPKGSFLTRLGLAFPVGIGMVTFLLFLISAFFGIRFTLPVILFSESVFLLTLLAVVLLRLKPSFPKPRLRIHPRLSIPLEMILVGFLIAFVAASFAIAIFWPPYIFDTLAMFDFRARLFAQAAAITGIDNQHLGSYPLLTSMSHAWAYIAGADNPKFVYPLFYLSLLAVFWSVARRHLSSLGATTLTLILATTPVVFEHSVLSYTNLAHSFFLSLGIIFLAEYLVKRQREDLLTSSLLFGLTAWVRAANEPFILAFALLLFLFTFRERQWSLPLTFFGFFLVFEMPWKFYQRYVIAITPYDEWSLSLIVGLIGLNWAKVEPVWSHFWQNLREAEFLGATGWLFMFVSAPSLLLLKFFEKRKAFLVALLLTLTAIGVWTGISLLIGESWGWGSDWRWILGQSMRRMFIIFPPLFLYVVATSPLVKRTFFSK